jgi:plasmid rolling circle replication initiator protein Rep
MLQQRTFFSQLNVAESDVKLSQVYDFGRVWDKYRAQSLAIELIYKREEKFYKLAKNIENCSCYLRFCLNLDNYPVLKEASFCRSRYCYVCLWRKSLYYRVRLYKAYEKIKLQNCNYNFIFLTLTIKNCQVENLRETLNLMRNAWHKLIKREQFVNAIRGWVRSVEITRDSKRFNTYAHPHFHCVLVVGSSYYKENYIKKSTWAQVWRECLCVDYTPVVDIRAVKSRSVDDDAVKCAIMETLKYSVKQADVNIDISNLESRNWFYILTEQTYKLRFFATGGIFKNAIKSDEEIDDEDMIKLDGEGTEKSDEKLFNFVFCRDKKHYRYEP